MSDLYLPITSDSLVINTTVLGQNLSLEVIPKGTQLVVYPEMMDSLGNMIPNPNPYQLPLIMSRTPYGKDGFEGGGNAVPLLGYAFVNQDMRGRYTSDGVYLPLYSDSWQKAPYNPHNHLLDITATNDSTNGRFHEDGWLVYQYLLNDLKKDYDLDGDGIKETNATVCNGTIGMAGASAFSIPHLQLMASHRVDDSPNAPGLKGNLAIIASTEHYRTTGSHNGVFREGLVTGWVARNMDEIQDTIGNDNNLQNNVHSPFDFGLVTEQDVIDFTLNHYTSHKYPGSAVANAYPNSLIRTEMDASQAPVDAQGEGDPNGTQSRYTNMNVPTYHLSGWYDIFVDGQIRTWDNLRTHTNTKQKLVIGPWAHTSLTMNTSGDITYPPQAEEVLGFSGDGVGFSNIQDLDFSKVFGSEPIEFLRYTLNTNGYVRLGEPTIRIPESNRWQGNSNGVEVRIPARNYDITLVQLVNFLGGQGSLPDIPIEARLGILPPTSLSIPFPNTGALPGLPFQLNQPINVKSIDFDTVPDIRFYVIGPTDSIQGNENTGNYWFEGNEFPLTQGVQYQSFYLHQNGELNQQKPTVNEGIVTYTHDPDYPAWTVGGGNMFLEHPDGRITHGQMNFADSAVIDSALNYSGVAQFETTAFTDTLSFIGFPKATIYAKSVPQGTSSGETDTDFFVRILDVYPDGRELLVIEGAVNARAREYARSIYNGTEDINAPFSNIQINQFYEYQLELLPIAYTFGKQHKMKVLISSANYPRYQSNPNIPIEDGDFFRRQPNDNQTYTYQGQTYSARAADNSITFSDSMASRIELPIYNDQNVAIRQINSTNQIIPLTISPNPAQTYINIDLGDQLNGSILIYDALGQVVLQSDNTNQNLVPLRIGQLAAGVYRVEYIQTTSTKRKIGSFIKK
jgi:predicted acyl esterase